MASQEWIIGMKFANGETRVNGLPCVLGRSPAKELLNGRDSQWSAVSVDHKYLSRQHVEIVLQTGHPNNNADDEDDEATPPEGQDSSPAPVKAATTIAVIKQFGKNPTFCGDNAAVVHQGASKLFPLGGDGLRIFFPAELHLPEFEIRRKDSKVGVPPAPSAVGGPISLIMTAPGEDDLAVPEEAHQAPVSNKFTLLERAMSNMGASPAAAVPKPSIDTPPPTHHLQPTNAANPPNPPATADVIIGKGWGFAPSASATIAPAAPQIAATTQPNPPPHNPTQPAQPTSTATPKPTHIKMGFWEWKSNVGGDDNVPHNWKRYMKAQADVLEAAFQANGGANPTVMLDDNYAVCFDDKEYGMVQYRRDDPTRWRSVRRRGGDQVPRPQRKRIEAIPCAVPAAQPKKKKHRKGEESDSWDGEDSYEEDSFLVNDDSDESFSDLTSSSEDASLASQSSSDPGVKRKRKAKKDKKHRK